MRIIVICETSGQVREALRTRGHDAWSLDVLPSKDNSPYHIICDMFAFDRWHEFEGMVFHPTCTYLTISAEWAYKDPDFIRYPGVGYHQKVKPETLTGAQRREAREKAIADALWGMALPIQYKVMENPIGVLSTRYRKPQVVQPHMFGDDASKGTCFWFDGLMPLVIPPRHLWHPGRMVTYNGKPFRRWSNQTDSGQNRLPQTADRWDLRSATYPGIASAVADLFPAVEQKGK